MMRNKKITIIAFCLFAMPAVVFANSGTPLVIATIFHLILGNALIGLLEGVLLARIFKLPMIKTLLLLVLANYFSAWIGGLFINTVLHYFPLDINSAWQFLWIMTAVTYFITLILEFPFVCLTFREAHNPKWLKNSILGNLLVQTISYVLLFVWYWSASGISLYTQTDVVKLSEIKLPGNVQIYFISDNDGNVYMMNPGETMPHKIFELKSQEKNDRLFIRKSPSDGNKWDLIDTAKLINVKEAFTADAVPSWQYNREKEPDTWRNFGSAARLGSAQNSKWDFWSGFWPVEGLRGKQSGTGRPAGFSFETPFAAWVVRNVTLLPDDKVLLQLGDNQICIFDPDKKQIALIAKGRGPTAIIKSDGHK